ncbi:hypothetical protein BG004_001024 [Podila humilis]|nr:hypothetical protein BG004_001024 [Podila humilis]
MNHPSHTLVINGQHDAAGGSTSTPAAAQEVLPTSTAGEGPSCSTSPPVPHIRIVPHLDAPRSLHFDVVDKDVPEGFVLKIGRFTDKQALPNRVTFKSKVVSRGHAEIFTENGKFYIRDTKSSSGTFLNHARLSPPGVESKPTQLKDGDVVQLGVDYQGGTQEIYRCVKMRLELNRSWQQQANPFRTNTLKVIRSLTTANAASATDCCICLFRIASFQSLFVAPCSHVYHYKCIRPLLVANHPGFLCPLCRTFADLEDSVEIDDPIEEDMPAEEAVAAAIENGSNAQVTAADAAMVDAVEAIQPPEPTALQLTRAEIVASPLDESYAPTPPSEQAHTFQPPLPTFEPSDSSTSSNSNNPVPYPTETDGPLEPAVQERVIEVAAGDGAIADSPSHTSAQILPVDIAQPSVHFSTSGTRSPQDTSAQPSPASAFFMAPSPPHTSFSSNQGEAPIPDSPSFRHHTSSPHNNQPSSVSPSNHMAAAGHMIQNFVRNISIPSRSRTRTNSNSPLNPIVHTPHHRQQSPSGSSSAPPGNLSNPVVHGQGDLHTDVFGKTLVVTPPPTYAGDETVGVSGTSSSQTTRTVAAAGVSDLPPVIDTEAEPRGEEQGEQRS